MRDEQIAKEIVQLLDEHSEHLNATVLSRLNTARQQALAASPDAYDVNQQGALRLLGSYFNQHRLMMTMLIVIMILMASILIQGFNSDLGDADLLGSDLPPEAYIDGDFDSWLSQDPQ
jgi:hypothetical protein